MATDRPLAGKRILTFVGDIYEDLELWYPKLRLIEAGAEVIVAGDQAETKYTGKNGYPCVADAAIAACGPSISTAWSCPAASCPTSSAATGMCSSSSAISTPLAS